MPRRGEGTIRNSTRILIALCLGGVVPVATSTAVRAQNAAQSDLSVVGSPFYESHGHDALFIVTHGINKDHPQKIAGIAIHSETLDEHSQPSGTFDDIATTFSSPSKWQKFLALWRDARAQPPHEENAFSSDHSYFDGATQLSLGKDSEGMIVFTMVGNPDANNNPDIEIFDLMPKDFVAFEATLKRVSLFFANDARPRRH